MEDVVAVIFTHRDGTERSMLTWGRAFGPVEYDALIEAVVHKSRSFSGVDPEGCEVRIGWSLQDVSDAPYFHECLFAMNETHFLAVLSDPTLLDGRRWLSHCREQIESGRYIWYLGDPARRRPD